MQISLKKILPAALKGAFWPNITPLPPKKMCFFDNWRLDKRKVINFPTGEQNNKNHVHALAFEGYQNWFNSFNFLNVWIFFNGRTSRHIIENQIIPVLILKTHSYFHFLHFDLNRKYNIWKTWDMEKKVTKYFILKCFIEMMLQYLINIILQT